MSIFSKWGDIEKFGFLPGMMGGDYKNPADDAMPYLNKIPGMLDKYMSGYINAGNQMQPQLTGQYNNLMNDPGGMVNKIGAGYHQSPGFQFALQQALQGAGHAAAAGGMAGSPQHEQQNMGLATNLANQDFNTWLQNALGMYGMGLQGGQNIYNTGANTSMGMGEDLASLFGSQGQLAYEGRNAQNQHNQGQIGSLISAGAQILPFLF